jgi:hypothetical protein
MLKASEPEEKVSAEQARQGRWGMHVLIILICSLILAGVVWAGVELYGQHLANEPAAIHLQQNKAP